MTDVSPRRTFGAFREGDCVWWIDTGRATHEPHKVRGIVDLVGGVAYHVRLEEPWGGKPRGYIVQATAMHLEPRGWQ